MVYYELPEPKRPGTEIHAKIGHGGNGYKKYLGRFGFMFDLVSK